VSERYLLKGGVVLTLASRTPNHHQADVLVEDGRIAEIGTGLRARDAEVIELPDSIIMPGFVDGHRHVWKSLFRNWGTVDDAVEADRFGPDDLYASTLIGLLGAVEAGTTTVVDWADIPADAACTDAALQAHADAGLRSVLVVPARGSDAAALRANVQSLAGGRVDPRQSLTTVALGSANLTAAGADLAAGEWSVARELGVRIHAHAGLDVADAGVVSSFAQQGLLRSDVSLVHGSHLSDDDLDAVASSGASIVSSPSTEMTNGLGAPPLQKFLDRKIQPGLAVDDEQVAPGDILAQMRMANSLQHASYFDLKLAGKAGLPNLLTTRDLIRSATTAGAAAIGLGAITGSLEVGKQADIIVFRTDRANIHPINDPIGAVVWGVDTSNLDWVFVGGQPVMREGRLAADVGRARALATEARDRVVAASGLTARGVGVLS
jgi:cytosine/adenosine deaminase-related metal-dependent hydrolase